MTNEENKKILEQKELEDFEYANMNKEVFETDKKAYENSINMTLTEAEYAFVQKHLQEQEEKQVHFENSENILKNGEKYFTFTKNSLEKKKYQLEGKKYSDFFALSSKSFFDQIYNEKEKEIILEYAQKQKAVLDFENIHSIESPDKNLSESANYDKNEVESKAGDSIKKDNKQRRRNKQRRTINVKKEIYNNIQNQNSIFKKIGSYILNTINMVTLSKENKELYLLITSFIEHGMLDKVVKIQGNGYELPKILQQKFDEKIFEVIQENPLPIFNQILKEMGEIPKEYLIAACFSQKGKSIYLPGVISSEKRSGNSYEYNQEQMMIHKYPEINNYMKTIITDKDFLKELIVFAMDSIRSTAEMATSSNYFRTENTYKERILNIVLKQNNFIFEIPNIWQDVTMNEYLGFIKELKNISDKVYKARLNVKDYNKKYKLVDITNTINSISQYLTQNIDKVYSDDVNKINNKIKDENYNVGNEIVKDKNNYTDLPNEAQTIIKKLYEKFDLIKTEEKNYLQLIDFNEVELIIGKRIPEIIEKYRNIHNEYKDSMYNFKGKNATQLMIESLDLLDKSLTNYIEGINEAKVSSLSATQRYAHEIYQDSMSKGKSISTIKEHTTAKNSETEVENETEVRPIKLGSDSHIFLNKNKMKI